MTNRTTHTTNEGYQEVTLPYRQARAQALQHQNMEQAQRIVCPMVDAARRVEAYGQKTLPGTRGRDLKQWAKALDLSVGAMKAIAYASGSQYAIPKNILTGSFDEEAINGGFVHRCKQGVHTGIYRNERFDQAGFEAFVWNLYPELQGTSLTEVWLYSAQADALYFTEADLPQVVAYNRAQSTEQTVGVGERMSKFEMDRLLLGVLGQTITWKGQSMPAISVQDVYDLYKYGFLPVPVEEKLVKAGLLEV